MQPILPHLQIDQLPPAEVVEDLIASCLRMPYVGSRESRMATPEAHALCLADESAGGPPEAFIDQHEFCLIQPLPYGTIHLTLPDPWREEAVRLGWGEWHPISALGIFPALTTLYAPRDRYELITVLELILHSRDFARGSLRTPDAEGRGLREVR